ncbi:MAG: peptide-methionine (R)-S-oxide reductase MsrB [Chitinophagaceae bacterium]
MFVRLFSLVFFMLGFGACLQAQQPTSTTMKTTNPHYQKNRSEKLKVSNEEWKKVLDPDVYRVARQQGTEYAFSGQYWNFYEAGVYHCAACGQALFRSEGKFESSCGWPSFFEPITKNAMTYLEDNSHGMQRVEVRCGSCDAHLGHIFDDGPAPTYKRYCINSVVIQFEKK